MTVLPQQENFLGLEEEWSSADADVVILPAPYETTSSYIAGSNRGPAAILRASHYVETYDEELDAEPYDYFRDGPLRYSKERRIIWSVGPNEADDGWGSVRNGRHTRSRDDIYWSVPDVKVGD